MNTREIYNYYSRPDVQQAILKVSEKREVIGVFKDGAFSTRPNTLRYPKDIMSQVRGGAVAFHGSLERWSNPMAVGSENYESGRAGWDLILDMDCKDTEHGKVAVVVFLEALKRHGVVGVSVKFTGGTGFHIGVPWESLPQTVDYRPASEQYPELARKIVLYLKNFSREHLERALLKRWSAEELAEKTGRQVGEIFTNDGIDPFKIVEVDPVLISPRHLFRMPYSLHEKTHLVSLPLGPDRLEDFRKEDAEPSKINTGTGFLDSYAEGEASALIIEAVDWAARQKRGRGKKALRHISFRRAVPIELAPPCIKNIAKGLADGKKRSLFILINYLSSLGWGWEEIEHFLAEWNEKNRPPLVESYLRGQVRWHMNRKKTTPPPNCSSRGYYDDFGVCMPDEACGGNKKSIKNPVNYAIKKLRKRKG